MASSSSAERHIHPGSGRRRKHYHPKGRQVDPQAAAEVRRLIGDAPYRRDLLIEYLHLVQDQYGHLSAAHLAALADAMRLAQTEVYEVATFYAHFDVVLENEDPPPPLTVRVCDSLTCELMGAQSLLADLPARLGQGVRVMRAPCMGRCQSAPTVEIGHYHLDHATTDSIANAIDNGRIHAELPAYENYDALHQQWWVWGFSANAWTANAKPTI